MDQRSEKIGALFANLSDHALVERTLAELYDENIVFQDPIQRVEGLAAFRAALKSMEKKLRDLKVRLIDDAAGERTLVVRWEMDFRMPLLPFPATIPGVSWMEFGPGGKCVRHTDYWDMMAVSDQLMPVLKPAHDLVRKLGA